MKNTLVCLILLLLVHSTKAQGITGKVYQAGTNEVLPGASVYYDGSMTGTTTDKDGGFTLLTKARQIPLVVSCIGYYSKTINYTPGQPLIIYLEPKAEELAGVTIHVDGMSRQKEIQLFMREFIGTSEYARSCIITNINDVYLFYNKKTRTLTASCDKPIIIENKKLGYTISCYLDKFEKTPEGMQFEGNCIFKESGQTNMREQVKINANREDAYQGSRMQFIRALWNHNIKKTEFYIYGPPPELVRVNEGDLLVVDSLGQKYLHLEGKIYITDNKDSRKASSLTSTTYLPFINKDGFYGPGLLWTGVMGSQRIGDMLPLEFQSEIDKANELMAQQANVFTAQGGGKSVPLVFEKVYLHTDRDTYTQGDTLWFKAYLINAQNNKPINSSGTLYVELLAPDSASILERKIIRMGDGLGNGDFTLTDSLPAGAYRLRAYTNWMRNFGDNFVFEKNITVLNTQAVPYAPDTKAAATKKITKNKPAISIAKAAPVIAQSPEIVKQPIVRFYPEGGSLVTGISSVIGVKAEDGYGSGIPVNGLILNLSGDTIARFSCDSVGIGLFTLLPVNGQSYHAVINPVSTLGRQFHLGLVFEMPAALSKGLVLHVNQTDSVIHILVKQANSAVKTKPVIKIKHAGKTLLSQPVQLQGSESLTNIGMAALPEGVLSITLFNEQGKPECERLVYVHHSGTFQKTIISTDKKTYQPKQQVNAQITAPANSNLSIAVVDSGIVPRQVYNITAYLLLQSEIRGNIENAWRYFDTTNINRYKQLDMLLLTQGWRDFVWHRMTDTAIRISYVPEDGIGVPGRIWDEVKNKMMPGLNVSLHADGAKGTKQFETLTNDLGHFNFNGLILYGNQTAMLSSIDGKGKSKGRVLVDTVLPMPVKPHFSSPAGFINPTDSVSILAIKNRLESMKTLKVFGLTKLKEVNIKSNRTMVLNNGSILTPWGESQIFNITPKDYQYNTLEWYLQQNTNGAVKPGIDPNRTAMLPLPPETLDPLVAEEYNRKVREYMRPLTGVAYIGRDTFMYKLPGLGNDVYGWRTKSKPIPPNIIVNGVELNMDNYEQAEAYRTIYFNMPMNKFKKIVLMHTVGTLNSSQPPILPVGLGTPSISWAQVNTITVDRYLLYLTLNDNALTDNPGALSADITGYDEARNFYTPLPNAKPSVNDYRTTIYWQPNIKTDAAGKANISFYNAVPQTNVRIIVQGIAPDGTPLTATSGYQVIQNN